MSMDLLACVLLAWLKTPSYIEDACLGPLKSPLLDSPKARASRSVSRLYTQSNLEPTREAAKGLTNPKRDAAGTKKVGSSMRGSPELPTWRSWPELLESASPIALPTTLEFCKSIPNSNLGPGQRSAAPCLQVKCSLRVSNPGVPGARQS